MVAAGGMSRCPDPTRRSSGSGLSSWPGCAKKLIVEIAGDLGISEAVCGTGWSRPTSTRAVASRPDEPLSVTSWCELRRERAGDAEVEILKRAAAYLAQENVLPK